MARSYGAIKVSVWEVRSDFRRLDIDAQWGYMMLISQPQLNNLGVLPYAPEKWHRFASHLTSDELEAILLRLTDERYVLIDHDTDEILVRTFVKHDKVWSQPKLVTNARRLIHEVESDLIRNHLTTRHPWLLDSRPKEEIEAYETDPTLWPETPIETPIHTPVETPSDTPPPDAQETPIETPIPTRARVRDDLDLDLDQDQDLPKAVPVARPPADDTEPSLDDDEPTSVAAGNGTALGHTFETPDLLREF